MTKFSPFLSTKIFPVLAPTSGDRKCILNGKYFPSFFIPNFPPFQIPYLSPFWILFYPRFGYPFYPRFRYPLYPRFRYTFYPRFRYPFCPRFRYTFYPSFCSSPFHSLFYPRPQCSHPLMYCALSQRQNRTQQRTVRMYSSPLISGHKSSGRSWSTFYPSTHANSILVVIVNKGAAMCTGQRQNRMRACAHIITTYCLRGTGTEAHRGAEWADLLFSYCTVLQSPETSEGRGGARACRRVLLQNTA